MEEQLNKLKEFLETWGINPDEGKLDDFVAQRLAENPAFFEEVIPLINNTKEQMSKLNEKIREDSDRAKEELSNSNPESSGEEV